MLSELSPVVVVLAGEVGGFGWSHVVVMDAPAITRQFAGPVSD
jgi:hypothetical protein